MTVDASILSAVRSASRPDDRQPRTTLSRKRTAADERIGHAPLTGVEHVVGDVTFSGSAFDLGLATVRDATGGA